MSIYTAERAVSSGGKDVSYVVIDQRYEMHSEATAYLAWLRALGRSPNTERVYAGRVAAYLSYCSDARLDWRAVTIDDLGRFLRSLVVIPMRNNEPNPSSNRFRSNKTANAIFTAVRDFLAFSATRGWVAAELIESFTHPKYLRFGPPGYDYGEEQQFRLVQARSLKLTETESPAEFLTDQQVEIVLKALPHVRDRLLVALLAETGLRIGEALGLRRGDMHFLSSSASLGCTVTGPHVHVRRRLNANGALAKSRFARSIPVTQNVVDAYAEYQHERQDVEGIDGTDFVFVNLYRPPIGEPLKYHNAKKLFDRASVQLGFPVRPHMLRHSAATRWLCAGVPRDVVQALLGHVSPASMQVYLHPTDAVKRAAVERAAVGSGEIQ